MNKKRLFKNKYVELVFEDKYFKTYGIHYGIDINKMYPNPFPKYSIIEESSLWPKISHRYKILFKKARKWRIIRKSIDKEIKTEQVNIINISTTLQPINNFVLDLSRKDPFAK